MACYFDDLGVGNKNLWNIQKEKLSFSTHPLLNNKDHFDIKKKILKTKIIHLKG